MQTSFLNHRRQPLPTTNAGLIRCAMVSCSARMEAELVATFFAVVMVVSYLAAI